MKHMYSPLSIWVLPSQQLQTTQRWIPLVIAAFLRVTISWSISNRVGSVQASISKERVFWEFSRKKQQQRDAILNSQAKFLLDSIEKIFNTHNMGTKKGILFWWVSQKICGFGVCFGRMRVPENRTPTRKWVNFRSSSSLKILKKEWPTSSL